MKDWLRDDERVLAPMIHRSVREWRRVRRALIRDGLLRAEVHPVEGPILRATHPEHIIAVGLIMSSTMGARR